MMIHDAKIILMSVVWLAGICVLLACAAKLNFMPKRGGIWINLKKFVLFGEVGGSLCLLLSPVYGAELLLVGSSIITASIGCFIFMTYLKAALEGRAFNAEHSFDFDT